MITPATDDIEKLIYYDSGVDFSELQKNIGDEFYINGYSFGNLGNTSGRLRSADPTKPAELRISRLLRIGDINGCIRIRRRGKRCRNV